MDSHRKWTIGTHQAYFEEPDLLMVRYEGPTKVEHIQRVVELFQELGSERPLYFVGDVSRSSIEQDARELLSRSIRPEWFHSFVYIGAGLVQKAMTKAIMLALFFTGRWNIHIEFVETEQQARELIARHRAQQPRTAR